MRRLIAAILVSYCWTASVAAEVDQPWIKLNREGDRVILTFTGTLQSASATDGTWTDIPNAGSPFTQDATETQRFYRAAAATESIFSSRSVVAWIVTAPLQTHFNLAFAGSPDGIFPPRREKPYFDGKVKMGGTDLTVTMRVRGNSSLQECPFPKLKLKVSKEDRKGTPFFDAREIKIGTHCADGGHGNIGRLRDERATYREALAYETMALLDFTAPRVRRARIEFRDTSPTNAPVEGGWQLTRNAVILDDVEVVAERLGGRALDDAEIQALTDAGFTEQLITDLEFLHVLLGNWDYELSQTGEGLWNTEVVRLPDGTFIPVAGDFDLASWVTEQVRSSAPRDYHPEWAELDREARYGLEQIQRRVKPETFNAARDRFTLKRTAMESLIQQAEVDEAGRTNALQHVTSFFDAITAVAK